MTGPLADTGLRGRVCVVTDSSSSLSADDGAAIVALRVDDGATHRAGEELGPADALEALRRGRRLVTSGPPPADFESVYADAAARGATGVVSVHLSGELSSTVHTAAYAASRAPLPVRVVDSRTVAMGLGFAAREAARLARSGAGLDDVARRAGRVADSSTTMLLVDSLDHLRRGGRISATAAALGAVLGVRPLIAVTGGRLDVAAKLRGRAGAVDRLVAESAAVAARCVRPRWAVQSVGADDLAAVVARRMRAATGVPGQLRPVGPVLAAHVGPGAVGIIVADTGVGDEADLLSGAAR